mmetsp:Transcript_56367/g.68932  ORF Transcript_56367/g.68932 Transcript_56367/m.68932 type:complete len:107 (+) Transcript_56367:58-378(+)
MAVQEYKKKHFLDYTVDDVNNWLRYLPNAPDIQDEQSSITACQAKRISDSIDDLELTGQDMFDMDAQDLKDLLPNVPRILIKKLHQHIRIRVIDEVDDEVDDAVGY